MQNQKSSPIALHKDHPNHQKSKCPEKTFIFVVLQCTVNYSMLFLTLFPLKWLDDKWNRFPGKGKGFSASAAANPKFLCFLPEVLTEVQLVALATASGSNHIVALPRATHCTSRYRSVANLCGQVPLWYCSTPLCRCLPTTRATVWVLFRCNSVFSSPAAQLCNSLQARRTVSNLWLHLLPPSFCCSVSSLFY